MSNDISLSDLPCGVSATVSELLAEPETRLRLLELGMMPGAVVSIVRRAPFGCPMEVELGGARYTMRRETTSTVRVKVTA